VFHDLRDRGFGDVDDHCFGSGFLVQVSL
jgi:hypothetical protein